MKQLYKIYYLCLGTISFGLILHTIFIGSQHIAYGHQVQNLHFQQRHLVQEKTQLERELASAIASDSISEYAQTSGFVSISQVETIDTTTLVAAR